MKIAANSVVSIHYKLTNDGGEEIDSSEGQEPLTYLHGSDNIVPGLENALLGKGAGEQLQVTVQPEDGYGQINPDMVEVIPHDAFEGLDDVKPGIQFQAESPEGHQQIILVKEVSEAGVTIDTNHPLAGQVLHFDITIAEVRESTEEEREHGHAH